MFASNTDINIKRNMSIQIPSSTHLNRPSLKMYSITEGVKVIYRKNEYSANGIEDQKIMDWKVSTETTSNAMIIISRNVRTALSGNPINENKYMVTPLAE